MLVGVVSDTHNNLKNIEKIISLFNNEKITLVFHTGDITNSKSLEKFSTLNADLIGVYGNNDRNEVGLNEIAIQNDFQFQEPPSVITLCDRNIAIFHEPDVISNFLSENKDIDLVIHGHTHRYRHEIVNDVLLFNPGESAGMQKGKNAIGIIDLNKLKARRIFF